METRLVRQVARLRLRPTHEQEQRLRQHAGARRFISNWAIARKRAHYASVGTTLPAATLSRELTTLKRERDTAWLKEINAQTLQQALADVEKAYANFFARRARLPHFKSKKTDRLRFRVPQGVRVSGGMVTLPKIGNLRVRQGRQLPGVPKSATVSCDAVGHWHICIVCEVKLPILPPPPLREETAVGIDLGVRDLAVLSDGTRTRAPRSFRRSARSLRRAQKGLARKKIESRNREKARHKIARIHRRIADRRRDATHQLTSRVVRMFDTICIEDLAVGGLAKTKLALSIHDANLGEVRRQLTYKCDWQGKRLVTVSRWYPSSKTCHRCGWINRSLTLRERTWTCGGCGTVHDRDDNAALNIKHEGLRVALAMA